jgi:ABC-2 type transport system ATP-binding protein
MSAPLPAIRFENLRKRYGNTTAVEELSFEVNAGEIFGLIGPDGAGKTTAMRIACGLLLPDAGDVWVAGRSSVTEPAQIKQRLGYMPQRFSLYPDLTVAENLRFFADLYDVPDEVRREHEERLMQFSRLGPFRDRRAGKLSGGMKQKLALSCNLIHTPEVLILDEPTTGVDPVSRREFWEILKELAEQGTALLVSTPYMDEALLCRRVALMHQGRVIALGTPDEVTRRFVRRLIEIKGSGLNSARQALSSLEREGIQTNRFGDRLHVVFDTSVQEQTIRAQMTGLSVSVMAIPPTIEDTFVALMEQPTSIA